MKTLNPALMRKFLKAATSELKGEWILLGGTLLPAVGLQIRSTVDIDLVGLSAKEAAQSLEIMRLADKLGLDVHSINQAAAFFLREVGFEKKDLIPLQKGKSAIIYRPSVRLYWKLKAARLSESDVSDCVHYLRYGLKQGDKIDSAELLKILKRQKTKEATPEKLKRLQELERALG